MENNNPINLSELPLTVLQSIFDLLPLPMIFRLHILSKEWNQLVTTSCGRRLFAIVSEGGKEDEGRFHIRAFDIMHNRWYILKPIKALMDRRFHHLTASDGGLVCFVSQVQKEKGKELEIVVCNPLTRKKRVLPRSEVYYQVQPKMVKLIVNHENNNYEVILAGYKGPSFKAEVYNSHTGAWSDIQNSAFDCVFGYFYSRINGRWIKVPMAVDCRPGQKLPLSNTPWIEFLSLDLVKDHLFVLGLRTDSASGSQGPSYLMKRCHITEFRCQRDNPSWVPLRAYEMSLGPTHFSAGELVDRCSIYACSGFILIIGEHWRDPYDVTLVYDLPIRSGCRIADVPERVIYDQRHLRRGVTGRNHWPKTIMCELRWDVVP